QLDRRVGRGAFDLEQELAGLVPAGAAELARPHHRAPAVRVQDLLPAADVVGDLALVAAAHAALDVVWKVGGDEGAHLVAECEFFGTEVQVHGGSGGSGRVQRVEDL